jgi:hypothetical protein
MQFSKHTSLAARFTPLFLVGASCIAMAIVTGCSSKQMAPPAPAAKPVTVVTAPEAPRAPTPAPAPAPVATAAPAPAPVVAAPVDTPTPRVVLKAEAGLMRCEDKVTVGVKRIVDDGAKIFVSLKGAKEVEMIRVATDSGALRYESKTANLALIYVVGRVFMLDTKRGSRVANDCNL